MSRWKAPMVAAAVIFVVGQAGTVMLARNAEEQAEARRTVEFENQVDDAVEILRQRLLTARFAVDALDGLFRTDESVDRREFHDFAQSLLDIASVRNLSFVKAVPADEKEEFIRRVRRDTSLSATGYPDFLVHPETANEEMFVPLYIEPLMEGNPAFGFDLGTDPTRRAAIERARDTGTLVASQAVDLVSDSSRGILLMLPIYKGEGSSGEVAERRNRFVGSVQAVIALDALLQDLPGVGSILEVEIYDSTEPGLSEGVAPLLYQSGSSQAETLETRRAVHIGDRTWRVLASKVAPTTGFGALDSVPTVVTFAGTLLTLALAITVFTIVDSRERAHQRARLLTTELREQAEHLRLARDHAIEADRLKTAFLANMSHELRTPLTAVIGLSSVLLKEAMGSLEGKQRDYVEMISTSGAHLLDIVDDMLDLARIEAGREELNLEETDLVADIEATLAMIRPHAETKGVGLTRPELTEPLIVRVDRRRIQQVLLNILSNAVKFTDRGGQAGVTVIAMRGSVEVTIWDTGIGIPEDQLPKVFAPFHQVDSSLARSRAGSGLGLALAKRLTEMHRGALTVSSREAIGTEFTLTLPLVNRQPVPAGESALSQVRPTLDGSRVLVAEDNEVNRMLMTDLLRLAGGEVLEAVDGEEALTIARQQDLDLIVLDIMLPVMDGITVARLLKSDRKLRRIPIIAVTALAMPEEKERILAAGCDSYLAKPFTHDQYLRAVADLLATRTPV